MNSKSSSEILLSRGGGNYFFGFHDLVAWNADGDKMLALEIDDISTPPNPQIPCNIGFIKDGEFTTLGTTHAYNFPQGSRQQWIGQTNTFVVNDKVGDTWGSVIYDAENLKQVDRLLFPTHVITDKGWAFGIDYARLHRVGGYGYTGILDKSASSNAPDNIGIIKHNIYSKENVLLISISKIANFQMNEEKGKHHYITHLLLNPDQDRIAFLHRYKLKDGGETTRLMTIGTDGRDIHCLATGFLSHFDWKDNSHIAIWGRIGSNVEKFRNSFLYRILPSDFTSFAKKLIKRLRSKPGANSESKESLFNWLIFNDADISEQTFLAKGVINEDGHPMFCPANRDWMICDTYPDDNGIRELFLFQYSTQRKIELGKYKMIDDKPDISKVKDTLSDVEASVLSAFAVEKMAFYRSGFHCDLHPRWKSDGTMVAFDSIHEGKRLIYGYDVSNYLEL